MLRPSCLCLLITTASAASVPAHSCSATPASDSGISLIQFLIPSDAVQLGRRPSIANVSVAANISEAASLLHAGGVEDTASTISKSGVVVRFDASQPWSQWYRNEYPNWEVGTFKVFQRFVDSSKVVLDVGAWIGPTALWLGHVAKTVVALEPTTTAFREFSANLAVNPEIHDKVIAVNAALDATDRVATMTNNGNSVDRIALINVQAVTIATLVKQQPVLQHTGFVKVDTEGYERVIVPALESFFKEKKPITYVSLHPMFISHEQVQGVVDKLSSIFPYLYEADMKTPFNTQKPAYNYGDHGGADVLCTWVPLV